MVKRFRTKEEVEYLLKEIDDEIKELDEGKKTLIKRREEIMEQQI